MFYMQQRKKDLTLETVFFFLLASHNKKELNRTDKVTSCHSMIDSICSNGSYDGVEPRDQKMVGAPKSDTRFSDTWKIELAIQEGKKID